MAGQLVAAAWSGSSRAGGVVHGGGHLHDLFLAWRLVVGDLFLVWRLVVVRSGSGFLPCWL